MEELLKCLLEMKQSGVISDYALGGATALIYYFEPVQTQDIDIFVILSGQTSLDTIVNLAPIYSFLTERGARAEKDYILFGTTPVQFLVPYNKLVEEAVQEAVDVRFMNTTVRIPPLEYLMAIMVQTGRGKDKARLEELWARPTLFEPTKFTSIIDRFSLTEKWMRILQWMKN